MANARLIREWQYSHQHRSGRTLSLRLLIATIVSQSIPKHALKHGLFSSRFAWIDSFYTHRIDRTLIAPDRCVFFIV